MRGGCKGGSSRSSCVFGLQRVFVYVAAGKRVGEAELSHVDVPPPHPTPHGDIASEVTRTTFSPQELKVSSGFEAQLCFSVGR